MTKSLQAGVWFELAGGAIGTWLSIELNFVLDTGRIWWLTFVPSFLAGAVIGERILRPAACRNVWMAGILGAVTSLAAFLGWILLYVPLASLTGPREGTPMMQSLNSVVSPIGGFYWVVFILPVGIYAGVLLYAVNGAALTLRATIHRMRGRSVL